MPADPPDKDELELVHLLRDLRKAEKAYQDADTKCRQEEANRTAKRGELDAVKAEIARRFGIVAQ